MPHVAQTKWCFRQTVVFFHAESSGGIGVILPKGMYLDEDVICKLNKAMNGTRETWGNKIKNTKKKHGFDELPNLANVYFHKEWELSMEMTFWQ